jgi:flagellar hook assembly protein FlgD
MKSPITHWLILCLCFLPCQVLTAYNGTDAVSYANQWWGDNIKDHKYDFYNTWSNSNKNMAIYYNNYALDATDSEKGGDCANFVSQCLIAGGLGDSLAAFLQIQEHASFAGKEFTQEHKDNGHDPNERFGIAGGGVNATDVNVGDFQDFFISYYHALYIRGRVTSDIVPGDVLNFWGSGNSHSTIITQGTGDNACYSSHTGNRHNEAVTSNFNTARHFFHMVPTVPFVQHVQITQDGVIIYDAQWQPDPRDPTNYRTLVPDRQDMRNPFIANGKSDLQIVVTFNESMYNDPSNPSITIGSPTSHTITNGIPNDIRTRWTFTLPSTLFSSGDLDGAQTLLIRGYGYADSCYWLDSNPGTVAQWDANIKSFTAYESSYTNWTSTTTGGLDNVHQIQIQHNIDPHEQDLMYRRTSDRVILLGLGKSLTTEEVNQLNAQTLQLFSLKKDDGASANYAFDQVTFKPVIHTYTTLPYQSQSPCAIKAQVVDMDDPPVTDAGVNTQNVRQLIYTSDDPASAQVSWHVVNMDYMHSDNSVYTGDEFDYQGMIPFSNLADGTAVHYYVKAADAQGNTTTDPATDTGASSPSQFYQFTVDKMPPVITLEATPSSFSPNDDGVADSTLVHYTVTDTSPYVKAYNMWLTNASGQVVLNWPQVDFFTCPGEDTTIWGGVVNGQTLPDGIYTLWASTRDAADNTATATSTIAIDTVPPVISNSSTQVIPANHPHPEVFTSTDTQFKVVAQVVDTYSNSIAVTFQLANSITAISRQQTLATIPGQAVTFTYLWDGKDDNGDWLPDGDYNATLIATDSVGNSSQATALSQLTIKRHAPTIQSFQADTYVFTPDDGIVGNHDTLTLSYTLSDSAQVLLIIKDVLNRTVQTVSIPGTSPTGSYTWDGKVGNAYVSDGIYHFQVNVLDSDGNSGFRSLDAIKNKVPALIIFPAKVGPDGNCAKVNNTVVVSGIAFDPSIVNPQDFDHYQLWARAGESFDFTQSDNNPLSPSADWQPIPVPVFYQNSSDSQYPNSPRSISTVNQSVLGYWNTSALAPGKYTLLLTTFDKGGNSSYDFCTVEVADPSVDITTPTLEITAPSQDSAFSIATDQDRLNISYTLDRSSDVSLDIISLGAGDVWGPVVYHADALGQTMNSSFNWNGKNELQSLFVADGKYKILLTARDSDHMGVATASTNITLSRQLNVPVKVEQLTATPTTMAPGDTTNIAYEVSKAAHVKLTILDASGTVFQILYDGSLLSGTLPWTTATEGLYTCKLEVTATDDATTDQAALPIAVTTGTGSGVADITSPLPGAILQGQTLLNWSAQAKGEYYPPQAFTCNVTAHGKQYFYPPYSFNWTVTATGIETYIQARSGTVCGTDGFTKAMEDSIFAIPFSETRFYGETLPADVYRSTETKNIYFYIDYGTTYPQSVSIVPDIVSVTPIFNELVGENHFTREIISYNNSGFVARITVPFNVENQYNTKRWSYPDGWLFDPWEYQLTWRVDEKSCPVTAAVSGSARAYTDGSPSTGQLSYNVTLPTPHNGTISNIDATIMTTNGYIGASISKNISTPSISGNITCGANGYQWELDAEADETVYRSGSGNGHDAGSKNDEPHHEFDNFGGHQAISLGAEWSEITVTYDARFSNPPSLTVTAANSYNNYCEIINQDIKGFTARAYVLRDIHARDIHPAWLFGAQLDPTNPLCHLNDWYTVPPAGVVFNWKVSGKITQPAKASIGGTDFIPIVTPHKDYPFGPTSAYNLTIKPTFAGSTLSNAHVVTASPGAYFSNVSASNDDYDDNLHNVHTILLNEPTLSGMSFSGVLRAINSEDRSSSLGPWSKSFVVDSSITTLCSTALGCFYNHPWKSVTLQPNFFTHPTDNTWGGFVSSGKYTVDSLSNTSVTPSFLLNEDTLSVTTTAKDTSWTTLQDPALSTTQGKIVQRDLPFNGNTDCANFFTETGAINYASAYPLADMTATPAVKNKYTFWNDGIQIIANPYVGIDADAAGKGWQVSLAYPDGTPVTDTSLNDFLINLRLDSLANQNHETTPNTDLHANNPVAIDDQFSVQLAPNAAPQRFLAIRGMTSNTIQGFKSYALFYQSKDSATWLPIGIPATQPVAANGVLGYWNVTALQGDYVLRLVVWDNSGISEKQCPVTIGVKVAKDASTTSYVAAPCNKAYLEIPAGALSQDQVINITPVRTTSLQTLVGMPQPIGPIYHLQPEGLQFAQTAMLSVRMLPAEMQNIDPGLLKIHYLKNDGTFEALDIHSTHQELTRDGSPQSVTVVSSPIGHFSDYAVMTDIQAPVLNPLPSITHETYCVVSGTAEAGCQVEVFVNDVGGNKIQVDNQGLFTLTVGLTTGQNQITAHAIRIFTKGCQVSKLSDPINVCLDPTAPVFLNVSATQNPYAPENASDPNQVRIGFDLTQAGMVEVNIEDQAGGLVRSTLSPTYTEPGTYAMVWDGKDATGALVSPGRFVVQLKSTGITGREAVYLLANSQLTFSPAAYSNYTGAYISAHTLLALSPYACRQNITSLYYRLNQGAWQATTANLTLPPADGLYTMDFFAVDDQGNTGVVNTICFALDCTAPNTELLYTQMPVQQADGNFAIGLITLPYLQTGDQNVNGVASGVARTLFNVRKATDPVSTPDQLKDLATNVFLPTKVVADVNGNTHACLDLPFDTYAVDFMSVDAVGNTMAMKTRQFTITSTLTSQISSPGKNNYVPGSFTISGTASGSDFSYYKLEVYNPDTAAWELICTSSTKVDNGTLGSWQTAMDRETDLRLTVVSYSGAPNVSTVHVFVDATPPHTWVAFLDSAEQAKGVAGGQYYISPGSRVCVAASDEFSGVKETHWSVDGVEQPLVPVSFSTGTHTVSCYSVDRVGNAENPSAVTLTITTQAPTTTLTVGQPQFTAAGNLCVLPSTPFTLTVTNSNGDTTGAKSYWSTSANSTLHEYTGPFTLAGNPGGPQTIYFHSQDAIGNVEPAQSISLHLDLDAPQTVLTVIGPAPTESGAPGMQRYATSTTKFSLSATDADSGVQSTEYMVAGAGNIPQWQTFQPGGQIQLNHEGLQVICYWSCDYLGNMEQVQSYFLIVDNQPPVITANVSEGTAYPLGFAPVIQITDDNLRSSQILLDQQPFVSGTALTAAGDHVLDVSAADWAGNTAACSIHFSLANLTPTSTATVSPTCAQTDTFTPTPTPSPTLTQSPTWTLTPTVTPTPSVTPTPTSSPTVTVSPTITPTSRSTVLADSFWLDHFSYTNDNQAPGDRAIHWLDDSNNSTLDATLKYDATDSLADLCTSSGAAWGKVYSRETNLNVDYYSMVELRITSVTGGDVRVFVKDGQWNQYEYVLPRQAPGTYAFDIRSLAGCSWSGVVSGFSVVLVVEGVSAEVVLDYVKIYHSDLPTQTATCTLTPSPTFTSTVTATPTATSSLTPTPSPSATASLTPTATSTSSPLPTFTPTPSVTATPTSTPTPTVSATPTATPRGDVLWEEHFKYSDDVPVSHPGDLPPGWQDQSLDSTLNANLNYSTTDSFGVLTTVSGQTWGKVLSPKLTIDCDYYRNLEINVTSVANGSLRVFVYRSKDGQWEQHECVFPNTQPGVYTFDIPTITGWSGTNDQAGVLLVSEGTSAQTVIDSVKIYHGVPPTASTTSTATATQTSTSTPTPMASPTSTALPLVWFEEHFKYSDDVPVSAPGDQPPGWRDATDDSTFNAELAYTSVDTLADLTTSVGQTWGKVLSPEFSLPSAGDAYLEVDVNQVTSGDLKIYVCSLENGWEEHAFTPTGITAAGTYIYNVRTLTGWTGAQQRVLVQLIIEGAGGRATLDAVRVYGHNPYACISSPVQDSVLSGSSIDVLGAAQGDQNRQFAYYQLAAFQNGQQVAFIIESGSAVSQGQLGTWDLSSLTQSGLYELQLTVFFADSSQEQALVQVQVQVSVVQSAINLLRSLLPSATTPVAKVAGSATATPTSTPTLTATPSPTRTVTQTFTPTVLPTATGTPVYNQLLSPASGSLVNGCVHVVGLVQDRPLGKLAGYSLDYRELAGEHQGNIAAGPKPEDQVLGVWDTTKLPEGNYRLTLTSRYQDQRELVDSVQVTVGTWQYLGQIGTGEKGNRNTQFNLPWDAELDAYGQLYVSDSGNDRVQKFDALDQFLLTFGNTGRRPGEFQEPTNMAIGPLTPALSPEGRGGYYKGEHNKTLSPGGRGEYNKNEHDKTLSSGGRGEGEGDKPCLYVVDSGNRRVQVFDLDGNYIQTIRADFALAGNNKLKDSEQPYPVSVAFGPVGSSRGTLLVLASDGKIYFRNTQNELKPLDEWPEKIGNVGLAASEGYTDLAARSSLPSPLKGEGGAAVANQGTGNYFDRANPQAQRVEKMSEKGQVLFAYTGTRGHYGPQNIMAGPWGNVWVTDSTNHRVQEFGSFGNLLGTFGAFGSLPGQFDRPHGIVFKYENGSPSPWPAPLKGEGNISAYVVDMGNQRVQKFKLAAGQPAPTSEATPGTGLEVSGLRVNPDAFTPELGEKTVISYIVTQPALVKLQVLDLMGNQVRDLGEQPSSQAGEIAFRPWDGKNNFGQVVSPQRYVVQAQAVNSDSAAPASLPVTAWVTVLAPGQERPTPQPTMTPEPAKTPTPTKTWTPSPQPTPTLTPEPELTLTNCFADPNPFVRGGDTGTNVHYTLSLDAQVNITFAARNGSDTQHFGPYAAGVLGGERGENLVHWNGDDWAEPMAKGASATPGTAFQCTISASRGGRTVVKQFDLTRLERR